MPAGRRLRMPLLTVHVTVSVGWIGAIIAYLVVNAVALTSSDLAQVRGAYLLMDPLLRFAIAPLAVASLVTGVILALVTRWGLLRHRWVVASLWLTIVAVALLFVHMSTEVAELTARAADPSMDPRTDRADLPNTVAGLLLVTVPLVLNIYKPRGLTRRGRRLQTGALSSTPSTAS
ncbi:hypothetical protein AB0K34_04240 [Actinomadura sp. NPDC049382]|uniref:hypothetical protein n=1 Tax=Actinomadura sp. NPDC049382 TaxID=3158220 RepID=UPI00341A9BD2